MNMDDQYNLLINVFLLHKSLYSHKQARRIWCERFMYYVSSIGFFQSNFNNPLFIYKKDTHMNLLLYVDEIIHTTHDLCKSIVSLPIFEFSMKNLGVLSYFFGNYCHSRLSHKKYVDEKYLFNLNSS